MVLRHVLFFFRSLNPIWVQWFIFGARLLANTLLALRLQYSSDDLCVCMREIRHTALPSRRISHYFFRFSFLFFYRLGVKSSTQSLRIKVKWSRSPERKAHVHSKIKSSLCWKKFAWHIAPPRTRDPRKAARGSPICPSRTFSTVGSFFVVLFCLFVFLFTHACHVCRKLLFWEDCPFLWEQTIFLFCFWCRRRPREGVTSTRAFWIVLFSFV